MSQITPARTPLDALKSFFLRLKDADRAWLALCCASEIDDTLTPIKTGDEATAWVNRFLDGADRPERRFGRLICLIAVTDFILSPFAVSRFAARAEHMTHADNEWLAGEGRRMLQQIVPLRKELSDAWKDVRTHELDEAALWVYRDEQERLRMAEIGRWSPQI